MKKAIILLLLVALALPLFARGQDEAQDSAEPTTVSVWNFKYSEEAAGAAFEAMDALYMEKNPNVVIDHVAQPHDNYYELLTAAIASSQGPDVTLTHTDQRIWNLKEGLANLDSYVASWKSDVPDMTWAACSASGTADSDIRIVPLTTQGFGIYYNKINLEKAGVDTSKAPSSWEDFLAACKALKAAGIDPIISGNQGGPYGIDFFHRTLLANFFGPELAGFKDGSVNISDERFVEVSKIVKELYELEYVNVENGSIPFFMDAIEKFKLGEGGFFIGLTSDVGHWKDFGDALGSENVGYFPSINHPKAKYQNMQVNQGAGIGMAILEFSEVKDQAADYLYEYVHGDSGSLWVEKVGAILPVAGIPFENEMLLDIVGYMNENAVPDFYNQLEAGFANESLYGYFQLFFIADAVDLDEYITKLQEAYEKSF